MPTRAFVFDAISACVSDNSADVSQTTQFALSVGNTDVAVSDTVDICFSKPLQWKEQDVPRSNKLHRTY